MASVHEAAKTLGEALTLVPDTVRKNLVEAIGDLISALQFHEATWEALFSDPAMGDVRDIMMPHLAALATDVAMGAFRANDVFPALLANVPELKRAMEDAGELTTETESTLSVTAED